MGRARGRGLSQPEAYDPRRADSPFQPRQSNPFASALAQTFRPQIPETALQQGPVGRASFHQGAEPSMAAQVGKFSIMYNLTSVLNKVMVAI